MIAVGAGCAPTGDGDSYDAATDEFDAAPAPPDAAVIACTEPSDCDDGVACTTDICESNICSHTPVHGTCSDGLFCNGAETCDVALGCRPGAAPALDDGIACTDDSCDEGTDTIAHTPNDGACDDDVFCNGAEICDPALGCQSGTAPTLDDGVDCTDDSCDEGADAVVHAPNDASCNDGLFCNGAETCDPALDCRPGTPPLIDDGVACTDDSCNEAGGAVLHTPNDATCNDGLFCNGTETCNPALDCRPGTAPSLDDGVACTDDACDEATDTITHSANDANCDDLDVCTVDTCDAALDCQHEPDLVCAGRCSSALVYDDSGFTAFTYAAADLGLTVNVTTTAAAFNAAYDAGGFDLLVVEASANPLPASVETRIGSWLSGTGLTIFSYGNLDGVASLATALGVQTGIDRPSPASVYAATSSPYNLFTLFQTLPSPIPAGSDDYFIDNGDNLTLTGAGFIAARHNNAVSGDGAICVTNSNTAIVMGFLPDEQSPAYHDADGDGDGINDIQELYTNEAYFLCVITAGPPPGGLVDGVDWHGQLAGEQ